MPCSVGCIRDPAGAVAHALKGCCCRAPRISCRGEARALSLSHTQRGAREHARAHTFASPRPRATRSARVSGTAQGRRAGARARCMRHVACCMLLVACCKLLVACCIAWLRHEVVPQPLGVVVAVRRLGCACAAVPVEPMPLPVGPESPSAISHYAGSHLALPALRRFPLSPARTTPVPT